jgi:DNA-binding winged helix-turn-helix (wHTH) protein
MRPYVATATAVHSRFGEFLLDHRRELLIGPQGASTLRPQVYALLCAMIAGAPGIVAHDALCDKVWGHRAVSRSAIAQALRELRRALGDQARQPRYIETRQRRGYRLIPDVVFEWPPQLRTDSGAP